MHTVLSFGVERKQLLAVARQLQKWVITLPRPSSPDTPPTDTHTHTQFLSINKHKLQLLYGIPLWRDWRQEVADLAIGSAAACLSTSCCQASIFTASVEETLRQTASRPLAEQPVRWQTLHGTNGHRLFFFLLSNWLNTQGSCEINQAIWLCLMHVVRHSAFVTQSVTYSFQMMELCLTKKITTTESKNGRKCMRCVSRPQLPDNLALCLF